MDQSMILKNFTHRWREYPDPTVVVEYYAVELGYRKYEYLLVVLESPSWYCPTMD
jgi:hypothetical protein